MAHFYGTIKGQRGEASRLGSKNSGLLTKAASWQGAVQVTLYERDGVDIALVDLVRHHGAGTTRTLYHGPVSGAGIADLLAEVRQNAPQLANVSPSDDFFYYE